MFYASTIEGDWQTLYFEYFLEENMPNNFKLSFILKRMAKRYFVEGDVLLHKRFNGELLRGLGCKEVHIVMKEVCASECGQHHESRKFYYQLLVLGYYRPTIRRDMTNFVKKM